MSSQLSRMFDLEHMAESILRPFERFFKREASASLLLIGASFAAIVLANSGAAEFYHSLWEVPIGVSAGGFGIEQSLHHWINDGLMAIFFFVVGLEIKREVLVGELSTPSQAALPVAAAFGGMLVPALIYTAFNLHGPGESGWGVPMATDIAFALGVISVFGKRAPAALVVFLTALAIVDDLGGILVIALFYTEEINLLPLVSAFGLLVVSFVFNRMGIRKTLPYVLIGVFIWILLLKSGIHATVAGVLLALTIPATRRLGHSEFVSKIQAQLHRLTGEKDGANLCPIALTPGEQQEVIVALEEACHDAEAPLQHIEHHLHPWVVFVIIPLFAFANAGLELNLTSIKADIFDPVTLGIVLGLFAGKQIGILGFTFMAVKAGLARLPMGVGWGHIYGASILGGIGFTMSLFIGNLAFPDPMLMEKTKLGILAASIVSGLFGYFVLRYVTSIRPGPEKGAS